MFFIDYEDINARGKTTAASVLDFLRLPHSDNALEGSSGPSQKLRVSCTAFHAASYSYMMHGLFHLVPANMMMPSLPTHIRFILSSEIHMYMQIDGCDASKYCINLAL